MKQYVEYFRNGIAFDKAPCQTLAEVIEYANYCHRDQKRKYTDDPYIVHPVNVMMATSIVFPDRYDLHKVAVLHDVIEDTPATYNEVLAMCGDLIAKQVIMLTDFFTKENFPNMNRAERKMAEARRLSDCPGEIQTIKLLDMIDNTRSIMRYGKGFADVYLKEKRQLVEMLTAGNEEVRQKAIDTLVSYGY